MAYKITQHRRGAYEEWLSLNVIPYEGELVIVEFDNNICKCKIGNGKAYFSDLPYITDWVIDELSDQIAVLKELTGKNLDAAVAELYQKIEDLISSHEEAVAKLRTDIDSKINKVTSDINTLADELNKVDGVVKTLVEPAVGELDAKYSEELSQLAEQHKADKSELYKAIEDKATELCTYTTEAIERNSKEISDEILNAKADITTSYTAKIDESVEALGKRIDTNSSVLTQQKEAIDGLNSELAKLPADIDKIAERVTASDARVREIISEIVHINQTIAYLQEAHAKQADYTPASFATKNASINADDLGIITEQLEDIQYKIATLEANDSVTAIDIKNINTEISNLATSYTTLSNQQKAGFNSLLTTINTLEAKLSKADSDANAAIASHVTFVNEELAKLTAADNLLYQVIYKIQDTLINKIDTADSAIRAELTDDVARINKSIADAKLRLDNQLVQAQAALSESVAAAKAELTKKIDSVEKLHGTKIEAAEAAIAALGTTISNSQATITSTIESIAADVVTNTANIAKNSVELNRVNTDLDNKISVINSGLAAANAKIDTQITNLEGKIQTKIDATDAAAQKQSEALVNLQDKVDDLLEELDDRITNKILDSKVDINLSIVEIRESIKQLKLAIEKGNTGAGGTGVNADILESIDRISDELVDLAADDVILYQVIYRIRDELLNNINKVQSDIQTDLSNKNTTFEQDLIDVQTKVDTDIAEAKNTLNERIDTVEANASTSNALLERVIFSKTSENANAISTLADTVNSNNTNLSNDLKALTTEVTNNKTKIAANTWAISQVNTALENKTKVIDADIDILDDRLDAQERRISGILALEDGSTTGDAELIDIRTGYNGEVYTSAGDAVRALGTDIQTLKNSLSQFIDSKAVDGLHYDYSGEVGLMQPYMLYLTAGDEIIQDSGVQIISGAGGGGGGSSATSTLKIGYITTSPVVVTPSDKAILYFTFSGTDSSGDIILQASATWKVNGITVANSVVKDGENEFDVTKYVKTGTTKVLLTVSDDNGSVVTKSWSIQQIELTLTSSFNDKIKYTDVIFDYTPSGAIEKTAVFKLDGNVIDRVTLGKEVSGYPVSYAIPEQTHGSHLLDVYLEAEINGNTVTSNHVLKDIIWYDSSSTIPVIGTSTQSFAAKQYSTTNIVYTVYDPANDTPTVTIEVDGGVVSTQVVKPNKDYGGTTTDIYSYIATTPGSHTIKICCGVTKKVITVSVEDIGISIAPVTTGLAFDFNPVGRNNGEDSRLWNHNDVHMAVSDNFDWINGGYIPNDPDGPCFCIKAGSSATIDYKLFANEAKVSGKEFKLIFKTKNASNPDAIFLSCVDNTTSKDHIGIEMGIHAARIYGKNGNLELAYSEDDTIEFEFNISKDTEAVPMVMGYEDGVPSRPMVYDSTYSFKQNTPKVITLGSPDCDLYIYRFKVYNTSLSAANILNNFIADARTADEMISRYTRNQIYDENQKLTAESLSERCPWLRVYKVSAPHFTNNKSDKVSDTTIQQIYLGGDSVLDNWVARNAQHSGQGTSSNNYGAAGRNLDFIMNKSNSYFELGDGTITDSITLTRKSVPVAYLNAKVNIASSNNLTNAILANRYNRFNPYKRPFVREDASIIEYIKDTMEMHNCVIFIQETDPDLTTHREFADTDWHFYAIGNIGDSKKTDKTRLTDPDDPYECCVEIMDVGLPLSAFPRDTMINAMGYSVDEKTGERNYTWAKDSNLCILHEKQEDGTYVLTSDTSVDLDKTYYVDILEHDDFSEDYTYGWRYISDDEDEEVVNTCKQAWIDFYRFVTTSTDEEFKANLSNYFVVDSALYYYLFTTRYCMVDNRAKNTFWHYSKTADGTRKWDLCWDYDNDTSLGLNNFGKQLYRYGLEDIDVDAAGKEVFRQSDSLFFCRIRDLFGPELKQMYQTLESKDAWNAASLITECDEWQEQFPEELWRVDIERKYIRTYNSSFISGGGDKQFLTNMANGRMKYHRRQWERSQEQYMASKYQTTAAMSESAHANFRVSQFKEEELNNLVIPPNYQFTLTPFSYIYLNVYYNSGSPISVRVTDENINTPVVVPYSRDKADIINVGSASAIRDFGDLAPLYADTVSVANATRVKKLKIGDDTPGYVNKGFSSLTTGSNGLLEELDITNITSFNSTLDLRALINLGKLQAFGTNIPSVMFAEGGKISYIELPAVNSLTLKNLSYLTTDGIKLSSYDHIVDLTVEGCKLVDQLSLLEACKNLNTVKLDNINFGTKTYEYFVENMFKIADATIVGTVHIESLNGTQFNELKARYPKLTVTYNTLVSNIKFMDTDNELVIYEQDITNAGDCQDPTTVEGFATPIKPATQEFTYEWFGWSEAQNVTVNYERLTEDDAIEAEQADYNKYRVDSIKRVEGDRVLYPVFKELRNSYTVRFINPTDNNKVLYSVMVPYGSDATYVGATPKKLDSASADLYSFTGWLPSPTNITGPLDCMAQFNILDNTWYTIGLFDITDCEDHNGNIFDGYSLNTSAGTVSITECKNNLNKAVKIPEQMTINSSQYTVVSLGGFRDHDNLELVSLPNSLVEIAAHGFYSCNYLAELQLPDSLTAIGNSAFQGCTSITDVHIPAKVSYIGNSAFADCTALNKFTVASNKYYSTLQDGKLLLENASGKLIQGLSGSTLTGDLREKIKSLGEYCFSNMNITTAEIPEGISTIPTNAFSRCTEMTSVKLPSTLTKLDATCFAWCYKLADVNLPEGLLDISTYVFNSTALTDVEIPKSVDYLRSQSYGSISTLKTVKFKKRLNADGTVHVPYIDENAFSGSGTEANPITFYVPWSEGKTPLAPWGAKNATIIYDYEEEIV